MTTYRNATLADGAELAALGRRSFTETFGHLYRPADLAAFLATHDEANWAAELADRDFAVRLAEVDGAAMAYAKLGPAKLPFTPRERAVELRQLYVLSPWHGGGVAATMMDWAIGEARRRGAADLYLSVFVDNVRAKRFYARHGFERVGTYAFMVGDHADEDDVMRLAL